MQVSVMLLLPVHDPIEIPTLMKRVEISLMALGLVRVFHNQRGRHIRVAHQHQSQRLETVVDMHAVTHIPGVGDVEVDHRAVIEEELVRVRAVVVFPGVLPDHVLAGWREISVVGV